MYKKNESLRSSKENIKLTTKQVNEIKKCENIFNFAKHFNILTSDGEKPIKLRDYQKKVLDDINNPNKQNNIIMMYRQSGKTVLMALYALHYAMYHKDKCVAIMANKESQALEIMKIIRNAYVKMPLWFQTGILATADRAWTKDHIKLANGSSLFVAACTSSSVCGKTMDLIIVDEFAYLPEEKSKDFMMSIFPTQVGRKSSKMILISTPHGMNDFYHIWNKSINNPESTFKTTKVSIYDDKRFTEDDIKQMEEKYGIMFLTQEYKVRFIGRNDDIEPKPSWEIKKEPKQETKREKASKLIKTISDALANLKELYDLVYDE